MGEPFIAVRSLSKVFGKHPGLALAPENAAKSKDQLLAKLGCVLALKEIDFTVNRSETFVAMGLSGSGKSTLVRCLIRLIEPTTGTMKVALPQGDLDVNLELLQNNVADWYRESVAAGTLVDLAGEFGNVENGATGQILETSMQGICVPNYMVEQNPGLTLLESPRGPRSARTTLMRPSKPSHRNLPLVALSRPPTCTPASTPGWWSGRPR